MKVSYVFLFNLTQREGAGSVVSQQQAIGFVFVFVFNSECQEVDLKPIMVKILKRKNITNNDQQHHVKSLVFDAIDIIKLITGNDVKV